GAHLAELLDRGDARGARHVDAAGAVGFDEIGKGPTRLPQLHARDAEAHPASPGLQIVLGCSLRRRRARGGIEDAYVGRAVLRRDQPREVETRVLHDDRRRHHWPRDITPVAPGEQAGTSEDGEDDGTQRVANMSETLT